MDPYDVTLIINCNMAGQYFSAGRVHHTITHGTIDAQTSRNVGDTSLCVAIKADADASKGCKGKLIFSAWDVHSNHSFNLKYVCNNEMNHSVSVMPVRPEEFEVTISSSEDAMKTLSPFAVSIDIKQK